MKKSIIVLSALTFLLALAVSNLTWADREHQEKGSGMKTSKSSHVKASGSGMDSDEKHSEDHKTQKASHLEEGSGGMQSPDQQTGPMKMEESSGPSHEMKTSAPMREGS
ncbi:MAG: hypothetical protein O6704_04470 [Nitrospinae bacterium]|nr:hypothetical protein [Nitrospinota bacterium]MCZ6540882.1 hypothetical protein [Nitrospinota bacterium]